MKYILAIFIVLAIIGVTFMAVKKPYSPTKIPYNNGFYAGPYNPKLPVIDPNAK